MCMHVHACVCSRGLQLTSASALAVAEGNPSLLHCQAKAVPWLCCAFGVSSAHRLANSAAVRGNAVSSAADNTDVVLLSVVEAEEGVAEVATTAALAMVMVECSS